MSSEVKELAAAEEKAETMRKRLKRLKAMSMTELDAARTSIVTTLKSLMPCTICLEPLETLASTTCGHVAHEKCLKACAQSRKKCPVCNAALTAAKIHPLYL